MSAQFQEHPLAHDRPLPGMMQDMDFPEAEQNFSRDYSHLSAHNG
jgi:hypothetical protein